MNSLNSEPRLISGSCEPRLIKIKHQSKYRLRIGVVPIEAAMDIASQLKKNIETNLLDLKVTVRHQTGSVIFTTSTNPSFDIDLIKPLLNLLKLKSNVINQTNARTASKRHKPINEFPDNFQKSTPTMQTDPSTGLSENEVQKRLCLYGNNQVNSVPRTHPLTILRRQLFTPQNLVLLASATISSLNRQRQESFLTILVTIINAILGYLSESNAEKIISKIGVISESECKVIRDGHRRTINAIDLVPGDLFLARQGLVPADIHLIAAKNLVVDESALTGESDPVFKLLESNNLNKDENQLDKQTLFRGTYVSSGEGKGIVVATGLHTRLGKIHAVTEETTLQKTPLQEELNQINVDFFKILVGGCLATFAVGIMRKHPIDKMVKLCATLAVAAIPESLPTVATGSLAISASKLRARGILPRRLEIVDALACIDTICLDKTGTLTMNDMCVEALALETKIFNVDSSDLFSPPYKSIIRILTQTLILCNDSKLKNNIWQGSPTEIALIKLSQNLGFDPIRVLENFERLKVYYRSEKHVYMISKHMKKNTSKKQLTYSIKGDPTQILDRCTGILTTSGYKILSEQERKTIKEINILLAAKGMRVLGIAYFKQQPHKHLTHTTPFIWIGLIALNDPIREGMKENIAALQKAGIKTIMLTGDQLHTAKAIAGQLNINISSQTPKIIDVSLLDDQKIQSIDNEYDGFARVTPYQKLTIVNRLQSLGHMVAMTGDGINDSPALKAAAVGVSMGKSSNAYARESADIILENDDIRVLIDSMTHARNLRQNIKNSIDYLLATNLSELLLVFTHLVFNESDGLSPGQLLWINLLTDILPSLSLTYTHFSRNIEFLAKPKNIRLFSDLEKKQILIDALIISLSTYTGVGLISKLTGKNIKKDTTHTFLSLTLSQLVFIFSAAQNHNFLKLRSTPVKKIDKFVWISFLLALLMLLIAIKQPSVMKLLKHRKTSRVQVISSVLTAIFSFVASEYIRQKRFDSNLTG